MGRKRQSHERKLRTREHILADLSANYIERQILMKGFAVSSVDQDYGLDLMMHTFNSQGEVESGHVFFQLKATDRPKFLKDNRTISLRVERADFQLWQWEPMPVILVLYDGTNDKAYWLNVHEYLDERKVSFDDISTEQETITVRIPKKNRLNRNAIEMFRAFRNERLGL